MSNLQPKKATALPKSFSDQLASDIVEWVGEIGSDPRLLLIIGGARIDDLLKRILKTLMVHDPGTNDKLFGPDRPLFTFSSRIQLAYRLGVLDRDFESFLQMLRELRNAASHAARQMDLTSSPHIDRVSEIQRLASKSQLWEKFGGEDKSPKKDPRTSLLVALIVAIVCLESVAHRLQPLTPGMVCSFASVALERDPTKATDPHE